MTNNSEERLTVKLISSDLFEFVIDRKCALASGAIKILLSSPGQFTESVQNEIHFRDINDKRIKDRYLYYKVAYSNTMQEVPAFPIEPEIAMELLNAADFLDC
ncbi:hypothetical protein HDV02_003868 [Globomyces sp. JEL0801]|nr:hypothetical protein HDV02_003868 [Globomyces sp. JEL0801]